MAGIDEDDDGPWQNRLIDAKSPYLRQHGHNPIDWYPWGQEAFDDAIARGVPIFLSVGYSACHWCHVMARESFSDPRIARFLNANFVNIKVDREEHPDVDAFCMEVLLRWNGEAGWPASIFLTPDRKPIQGGTYYPPFFRYGTPAFLDVLKGVRDGWLYNQDNQKSRAAEMCAQISTPPTAEHSATPSLLESSFQSMIDDYDERYGGWGVGARFPHAPRLDALLRCGGQAGASVVSHMLDVMDRSGIHDHLAGGFHRYAVDVEWEVPHFEKMLSDNAQLAALYLRAWKHTNNIRFLTVACETIEFLLSDFWRPEERHMSASMDADDPGGEGAHYTWTREELVDVLGGQLAGVVIRAFHIEMHGNFGGRTVLNRVGDPSILSVVRDALLTARNKRPAPDIDEKGVLCWNAMTVEALALASRLTGEGRYLDVAQSMVQRMLETTVPPRVLGSSAPAVVEDHAALISALVEMHVATGDGAYLVRAGALAQQMVANFWEGNALLHAHRSQQALPVHRVQWLDHAEPAGSAWALLTLLRLQAMGMNIPDLGAVLQEGLQWCGEHLDACPTMLQAMDAWLTPLRTVVVTGSEDGPLWQMVQRAWLPRTSVIRLRPNHSLHDVFSVVEGKEPTGPERVWICEGTACQLPISGAAPLAVALRQITATPAEDPQP